TITLQSAFDDDLDRVGEGIGGEALEHDGIADGAISDMEAQRLRRDLLGDRARHDARADLQAEIIKGGVGGDALRQLTGGQEILSRLLDPRRHEIADGAHNQHRAESELRACLHVSIIPSPSAPIRAPTPPLPPPSVHAEY